MNFKKSIRNFLPCFVLEICLKFFNENCNSYQSNVLTIKICELSTLLNRRKTNRVKTIQAEKQTLYLE